MAVCAVVGTVVSTKSDAVLSAVSTRSITRVYSQDEGHLFGKRVVTGRAEDLKKLGFKPIAELDLKALGWPKYEEVDALLKPSESF